MATMQRKEEEQPWLRDQDELEGTILPCASDFTHLPTASTTTATTTAIPTPTAVPVNNREPIAAIPVAPFEYASAPQLLNHNNNSNNTGGAVIDAVEIIEEYDHDHDGSDDHDDHALTASFLPRYDDVVGGARQELITKLEIEKASKKGLIHREREREVIQDNQRDVYSTQYKTEWDIKKANQEARRKSRNIHDDRIEVFDVYDTTTVPELYYDGKKKTSSSKEKEEEEEHSLAKKSSKIKQKENENENESSSKKKGGGYEVAEYDVAEYSGYGDYDVKEYKSVYD